MLRRALGLALALGSACPLLALDPPLTTLPFAGPDGGGGYQDGAALDARFYQPSALARDKDGNVYVADFTNHVIRLLSNGVVSTYAGRAGALGSADGPLAEARFNNPTGVALDPAGNLWIADFNGRTLRRVRGGRVVTVSGLAGVAGTEDGPGAAGRWGGPNRGMLFDASGALLITDSRNHVIRRVEERDGVFTVTTIAGKAGSAGSADGKEEGRFNNPRGMAFDSHGDLIVADSGNQTIRRVHQGTITTIAGKAGTAGYKDDNGTAALFSDPRGVALDDQDNIYVADTGNSVIRRINLDGRVTTLAGNQTLFGILDGTGLAALFFSPSFILRETAGSFLVTDQGGNAIRRVTLEGAVTTIAGTPPGAGVDGTGSAARFHRPQQSAFDRQGNLYVADSRNHTIRKITPAAVVTTLAGLAGTPGFDDGSGSAARFNVPAGLAVDSGGNVLVADSQNHTIRKITPQGVVSTHAGAAGVAGGADGFRTEARFSFPINLAVDAADNVYVTMSDTVRKITAAGAVTTLAGSFGQVGELDATGAAARLTFPWGITVDAAGSVYILANYTLKRITPSGTVTTIAGKPGVNGHRDGPGSQALLGFVTGIAVDKDGTLLFGNNQTIRRATPDGTITTIAGVPLTGGGRNGTGADALFSSVESVAVSPSGRVFVVDNFNYNIRELVPAIEDRATIEAYSGAVGLARRLDTAPLTATSWKWNVLGQPPGPDARLSPLASALVSTSSVRDPLFTPVAPGDHLVRLTASSAAGARISTVPYLAVAAPASVTQTVPIVLDVVGRGDAHFESELNLTNAGSDPVTLELAYTASIGSGGGGPATETLPPGRQLVVPDALAYLREKGLEISGPPAGGALRVTFRGASSLEAAFAGARTTAPSGNGRAGLAYPAVGDASAGHSGLFVFGLRETAADRSNLAMQNLGSGGPITLRIVLFDGSTGAGAQALDDITLGPGEWRQIGSVLSNRGMTNGYALVERIAGVEPFYAYGVFNDNVTSDGSYASPQPTDRAAETQVIPVLVETATFQSELILSNPTATALKAELTYVESLAAATGAPATVTETLQPYEQKILPEAIAYLRQKGATVGERGASYAGALAVVFRNAASNAAAIGFAGARTGAPAPGGGQYGLFYPAVGVSRAATAEATLFGLRQDGETRTNVAFVNAGTKGELVLRYEVFDGDARASAGSGSVTLGPGGWRQINGLLGELGIGNGYLKVTKVSGEDPFLVYAAINDGGGQRSGTNDGSYVEMSAVR